MLDSSHESINCIFSDEISYESIKNMTLLWKTLQLLSKAIMCVPIISYVSLKKKSAWTITYGLQ